MATHSPVAPSSAAVWGSKKGCTGYVRMAAEHKTKGDHTAADEGGVAHDIGANILNRAFGLDYNQILQPGEQQNGILVTDEMYQGAMMYAEDVLQTRAKLGPLAIRCGVEKQMEILRIHPECYGTPDAWVYVPGTNTLYVWDFKFGRVFVEPYQNHQAVCYVAGLEMLLGLQKNCKVVIKIVQPRTQDPIRAWYTTLGDLYPLIGEISYNAATAMSDRATLQTGPHCKYCEARHNCKPALLAGLQLFEIASDIATMEASPQSIGLQLEIIDRAFEQLKALQAGYSEQVKTLLSQGQTVPGWSIAPSQGRLNWSKPISDVIKLGQLMGYNIAKEAALTPTQAIAKGVNKEAVLSFSERKTGHKLTRDTGAKTARIFSKKE